jgi:hypothetical protein
MIEQPPTRLYTAEQKEEWQKQFTASGLYMVDGSAARMFAEHQVRQLIDNPDDPGTELFIGTEEEFVAHLKVMVDLEVIDSVVGHQPKFFRFEDRDHNGESIARSLWAEEDTERFRNFVATSVEKFYHPIKVVWVANEGLYDGRPKYLDRVIEVPVFERGRLVKTVKPVVFDVRDCEESRFWKEANGDVASLQLPSAIVSTSREFTAKTFKDNEVMLEVTKSGSPVLHHPSMGEVHAYRGVGKTNFILGLLNALATGSEFLCYKATRPFRTIDFDGEMDGSDLQESLRLLAEENDNFHMVARCEQPDNIMPSMATEQGLAWYEEAINRCKAEVAVFDNWSTLANIGTNEEEAFFVFTAWARKMRLRGVSVIYLHHDGKDKHTQRGHSKPEDPLNWVIGLSWASGYEGQEGLKCVLKFEKCRKPIREYSRITMTLDADGSWLWGEVGDEQLQTTGRRAKQPTAEQLQKLKEWVGKISERELAKQLGVSREVAKKWSYDVLVKDRLKLNFDEAQGATDGTD